MTDKSSQPDEDIKQSYTARNSKKVKDNSIDDRHNNNASASAAIGSNYPRINTENL
jgi:hypothetical protein